jgi:hypothetical protein
MTTLVVDNDDDAAYSQINGKKRNVINRIGIPSHQRLIIILLYSFSPTGSSDNICMSGYTMNLF